MNFREKKKYCFLLKLLAGLHFLLLLGTESSAQNKNEEVLISEMLGIDKFFPGMVFDMKSVADFLLVKHKQENTYFTLIDLKNPKGNVLHTGIIGGGPGELYNPGTVMTEKGSFSVLNDRSLITFYLDSILRDEDYIPRSNPIMLADRAIINLTRVGQSHYVSNEVTIKPRFSLLNAQGESILEFGEFPEEASSLERNPEYVNNVAYQSELTTNHQLYRVASATRYGEYITFIQIDPENVAAEIINEHKGELPLFDIDHSYGDPNFVLSKNSKAGYLSLTSNEDFIFALFSGKLIKGGRPASIYQ